MSTPPGIPSAQIQNSRIYSTPQACTKISNRFCTAGLRPAPLPLPFSSTDIPACANATARLDRQFLCISRYRSSHFLYLGASPAFLLLRFVAGLRPALLLSRSLRFERVATTKPSSSWG